MPCLASSSGTMVGEKAHGTQRFVGGFVEEGCWWDCSGDIGTLGDAVMKECCFGDGVMVEGD